MGIIGEYYLKNTMSTVGLGCMGVINVVKIGEYFAVSRQHFSVTFSLDHNVIQVENLSNDGIVVNVLLLTRFRCPSYDAVRLISYTGSWIM